MPRTIRFHLDEHVAHAIADGLRRRGADVTTTTAVGVLGASDPQQLAYALATGRVFFTEDRDLLALARGTEPAGIAYGDQNTRTIGHIFGARELLWEVYEHVGGAKEFPLATTASASTGERPHRG